MIFLDFRLLCAYILYAEDYRDLTEDAQRRFEGALASLRRAGQFTFANFLHITIACNNFGIALNNLQSCQKIIA